MRKVLFVLLATVCVCPAYVKPLCQDTVDCVGIIHSFNNLIDEKDSCYYFLNSSKKANDSITTIKDSLSNSNKAISNNINIEIQEFGNIILRISIVITIIVSTTSVFFTRRNNKSINNSKKEFEKWFESQKNIFEEFESLKKEVSESKEKKDNDIKINELVEIAYSLSKFKELEERIRKLESK